MTKFFKRIGTEVLSIIFKKLNLKYEKKIFKFGDAI